MTPERLKEIERALAATTPGEWRSGDAGYGPPNWIASDEDIGGNMVCLPPPPYCEVSLEEYWGANRAFIIAAHNSYIPELLAEVKRLSGQQPEATQFQSWLRETVYQEGFRRGKEAAMEELLEMTERLP